MGSKLTELETHAVAEYVAWRSTWRPDWPIGPLSNVHTFAEEVHEIEHDLGYKSEEVVPAVVRRRLQRLPLPPLRPLPRPRSNHGAACAEKKTRFGGSFCF